MNDPMVQHWWIIFYRLVLYICCSSFFTFFLWERALNHLYPHLEWDEKWLLTSEVIVFTYDEYLLSLLFYAVTINSLLTSACLFLVFSKYWYRKGATHVRGPQLLDERRL